MIFLFIFLGLFFGLNLIGSNLIIFIIVSFIALLIAYKRFDKKIAAYFLIALVAGIGLSFINIKINPNSGTYNAIVIESKNNYYIVLSKFEKLIIYENNNTKEVGDILTIKGSISNLMDTSIESEFSFVEYLKNKGITRQINVTDISYQFQNFIKLKAYKNNFLCLFDAGARDYIDAFLFNVKNYDNDSMLLAKSLDILYLFSNSGIYISFILSFIEYFLFLKLDRNKSKIGSLIILSWYLVFVLNKVAIRRILYIKIFSLINTTKLKKKFTYLEIVCLVSTTMLLVNKDFARQSAFYLGVFISLAFIFTKYTLARGKKKTIVSKTSVFAYLFSLPLSLVSSHEFHLLGFLLQTILMPFTFIFMFAGLISFYSYPIKPLFNFLAFIMDKTIYGMSFINVTISFKYCTSYFLLLYYLILFIGVYFLESYSYKKVSICASALLIVGLVKIVPYENLYADSISFINVGQGDSCLIRHKDKNIMIDTGGLTYKDVAVNSTIPYMRSLGINKLDYVFISHSDYDHSGALTSLKSNFNVKCVIDTSEPFVVTINDLEIKNINKWANEYEDINDKSQVLVFKAANKNIMMMGDASTNIEKKILEEYKDYSFNIDILKVGHHGSKTSSSYDFLKFIMPKEAVISVGRNNKFGHPNKEVITNLDNLKIPYKRTDEAGSITYYSNNLLRA